MNKYIKAISANLIFFGISTIFFFLVTPIAIKLMGEEFYGLWIVFLSLILLSNAGTFGIDTIVNKYVAEVSAKEDSKKIYNQIISAGFIIIFGFAVSISIILFALRNILISNINTNQIFKSQLPIALILLIIGIFPQFFSRVPQGFLLSQLKNSQVRLIDLLSSIFLWVGAIIIAVFGKNLINLAVWALTINFLTLFLYIEVMRKNQFQYSFDFNSKVLRSMLSFSGWMSIETISVAFFQQFDRILVGIIINPAAAGVYAVGTSIGLRLTMITKQVTEVMLPYTSLNISLGNTEKIYLTFRKLVSYVNISLAAISCTLIFWMPEIVSIWISPTYSEKYSNIYRIIIFTYSLFTIGHPGRQTLIGMGKAKLVALMYSGNSIIFLICIYILSKIAGLPGAAWSNITMIFLVGFNILSYKYLSGNFIWGHFFKDGLYWVLLPASTYIFVLFNEALNLKIIINLAILLFLLFIFGKNNNGIFRKNYFRKFINATKE